MIYAPYASAAFQKWFGERLNILSSDVSHFMGDNLVALILGGGYGRGEGGVVQEDGQEKPYNDIDLTIIVNEPGSVDRHGLEEIAKNTAKSLGIEVDFSRPLAPSDVENWPNSLMWHDLLNGHIVLFGDADILTRLAPPELARPLDSVEALRLLLNRGSGLLWAMLVERDYAKAPDPDFIRRNAYKCILALGDSILIASGRYSTQYLGRGETLAEVCALNPEACCLDIEDRYRAALTFKFTPDTAPDLDTSISGLRQISEAWISVFLYLERSRLTTSTIELKKIEEYLTWKGVREPAQNGAACWPRNVVQNVMLGRLSLRYPREYLYRRLPALLAAEKTNPGGWSRDVQSYLRIWRRFN